MKKENKGRNTLLLWKNMRQIVTVRMHIRSCVFPRADHYFLFPERNESSTILTQGNGGCFLKPKTAVGSDQFSLFAAKAVYISG